MSGTLPAETELRLEPPDTLSPELDYEYISSLYSASKYPQTSSSGLYQKPVAPPSGRAKMRRGWSPALLFPELVYTSGAWPNSPIMKEDLHQVWNFDHLDLHRMSERFYDRRVRNDASVNDQQVISEQQRELYSENLKLASFNDRLLKEAYSKLKDKNVPATEKRKIRAVVLKLEKLPHLYKQNPREQPIAQHVGNWLIKHTDIPEAEKVGFTSRDPFEPRMFIPTTEPRLSSSETNVVLGKRKRVEMEEDECELGVVDSASDTLLTERNDCVRLMGAKRRRVAKRSGTKPSCSSSSSS